jgi:predicted AlkP superfamily pyrophosphatase or phosphodiesterase
VKRSTGIITLILGLILFLGVASPGWSQAAARPKLVVVIVVDQMRADYLDRFAQYETGGLHYFATEGADFLNANYQHIPTETCVGHTVLLSGRNPVHTGIVANNWYDRTTGKMVYCVDDAASALVGGTGPPVSPKNLVGENFSDWFQTTFPAARVYSMSLKDRSAILMGGHHPKGAFWYSQQNGAFVTSTHYQAQLPSWAADFNARRMSDSYAGKDWTQLLDASSPAYHAREVAGQFPHHMPATAGPDLYTAVYGSPFGDETLEAFAESAITANQLGADPASATTPDLLDISFSSNDPVGHAYGPDSPEIADEQIRLDRTLGKFMDFLNQRLGAGNILWVLSADHGAEPAAEAERELDHNNAAQRVDPADAIASAEKQLNVIFHITDEMHWFAGVTDNMWYFDRDALKQHNITLADARTALATQVHAVPGVQGIYDASDLTSATGWIGQLIRNSNYPARSGDVYYLAKEWTLLTTSTSGASHADPWPYDTHVPLVFAGWGIQGDRISAPVHIADLAPTLTGMLGVKVPAKEAVDGKSLEPLMKIEHARGERCLTCRDGLAARELCR